MEKSDNEEPQEPQTTQNDLIMAMFDAMSELSEMLYKKEDEIAQYRELLDRAITSIDIMKKENRKLQEYIRHLEEPRHFSNN